MRPIIATGARRSYNRWYAYTPALVAALAKGRSVRRHRRRRRPVLRAALLQNKDLQRPGDPRSPGAILWSEICSARPAELLASGALYLAGLAFSGGFWLFLLQRIGEPIPLLAGVRTYYISHLGKYAPLGKGWALLLRTMLANRAGVRVSAAALTGAYETLTTMAAGEFLFLAAVLLLAQARDDSRQVWIALGLFVLVGVPIILFHLLITRLAARFNAQHLALPRLGPSTLVIGLVLTACGWVLLGGSLVIVLHALGADADLLRAADWHAARRRWRCPGSPGSSPRRRAG